jgi:hypothetical protein
LFIVVPLTVERSAALTVRTHPKRLAQKSQQGDRGFDRDGLMIANAQIAGPVPFKKIVQPLDSAPAQSFQYRWC